MSICVFGDSITYGMSDRVQGGWVQRLRKFFETEGYDISVYNSGICGDTSEGLLNRFQVECRARDPEMIIFAIGINDARYIDNPDNPAVPLPQFQKNIQELINQAQQFSKKIIFLGLTNVVESLVMPLPDTQNEYYRLKNIAAYNQHLQEVCQKNNLPFLDVLDLLSDAELEDGLHPDSNGHEKMYLIVRDYILNNHLILK